MAMVFLCRTIKSKKRPPIDGTKGNAAITTAVEFIMDPVSRGMRCAAFCVVGSSIFNRKPGYEAGGVKGRPTVEGT